MEPEPAAPPDLTWTDWPATRLRGRSSLAASLAVATVLAVGTFHVAWGAFAAAVLVWSVGDALLPTAYVVREEGVHTTSLARTRTVAWADLQGWHRGEQGPVLRGRGATALHRQRRTVVLRGAPDAASRHVERHLGPATPGAATSEPRA